MASIDHSFFFVLYSFAGRSHIGDFLIIFFGEYFLYIIFAILAYFLYRAYRNKKRKEVYGYFVALFAALFARFGVENVIHFFYHRPRPFIALHLPHLLSDMSYSFPSGHTIFMFALATGIFFVNRKFSYFLYASGLVIGLARVMGGVHYPSDILGGAILGILTGYIVYKLLERFGPKRNGISPIRSSKKIFS